MSQTIPSSDLGRLSVDRAAGVLLGTACGDALGAGYEFDPPMPAGAPVGMIGGGLGPFAPGEWTDDTSMAVAVAQAAAAGLDLRTPGGLDVVADGFRAWFAGGPKDVGNQTRAVLSAARTGGSTAMTAAARARYAAHPHSSAGNGGLMRTAAVALAHLRDPGAVVEAARAVNDLTHADPVSAEACVIWSLAIRHAVLHGTFDGVRLALDRLPADRATWWADRLGEAEQRDPASFRRNGWVVEALQGAWSAISRTPIPLDDPAAGTHPAQHLRRALEAAVRGGGDTDTVAAIAGGLLGARWGASAVPASWRRQACGWPGHTARDLQRLAITAARRSVGKTPDDRAGWPSTPVMPYATWPGAGTLVVHPHDDGVLLGGFRAVTTPPAGVDAVVSLCRLGWEQWPAPGVTGGDHVTIWHADDGPEHNPHLDHVLREAAGAVAALRAEGKTVLLHCVAAQSRTPTVAALYAALHLEVDPRDAVRDVVTALPDAAPNPHFQAAIGRLTSPLTTTGPRSGA